MVTKVIMPKQGLQMTEGTITKWLVAEGDKVEVDQPLFEMETDKTTLEIEATVSGTLLKIIKTAGEVVPIAETIAFIGERGDETSEYFASDMSVDSSKTTETEKRIEDTSVDVDNYLQPYIHMCNKCFSKQKKLRLK